TCPAPAAPLLPPTTILLSAGWIATASAKPISDGSMLVCTIVLLGPKVVSPVPFTALSRAVVNAVGGPEVLVVDEVHCASARQSAGRAIRSHLWFIRFLSPGGA